MEEIFLKLNFIAQQSNVIIIHIAFKQATIHGAQRLHLPEIDRQPFKKNSFQRFFKCFISLQRFRRKFPIARK